VIGLYSSKDDAKSSPTTSVGLFIGANGLGLRGSF